MSDKAQAWCVVIALLVLIGIGIGVRYYKAETQAEVYRREGIQMSTWEVLMGAKPAERSVIIKDGK